MASALATGWLAGRITGSRLAAVIVPLAHVIGFEIVRSYCQLPTAGAAPSGTSFGLVAFALGRVIPWLLAVVPLALGAGWGARRLALKRRWPLLAATTALALLAGWLLIPPTAAPVQAEGGFAELVEVELGGHRQWIQVRGTDPVNPVVLYLSGGPGQSDQAFSRVLLEPLLDDITLVSWDQRGTGKSYPQLDQATLTPQGAVDDVVELSKLLAQRFGQDKIVLLGESWGTLLGVLAVQQAPELFSAYVGSGQMVDVRETDEAIYDGLAELAARTGDAELTAQLARLGRPPYRGVLDYGEIMLRYPLLEGGYTPPAGYRQRAAAGAVGPMGILGVEYGPIEKLKRRPRATGHVLGDVSAAAVDRPAGIGGHPRGAGVRPVRRSRARSPHRAGAGLVRQAGRTHQALVPVAGRRPLGGVRTGRGAGPDPARGCASALTPRSGHYA